MLCRQEKVYIHKIICQAAAATTTKVLALPRLCFSFCFVHGRVLSLQSSLLSVLKDVILLISDGCRMASEITLYDRAPVKTNVCCLHNLSFFQYHTLGGCIVCCIVQICHTSFLTETQPSKGYPACISNDPVPDIQAIIAMTLFYSVIDIDLICVYQ